MKYPDDLTGLDFGGLRVVRRAGLKRGHSAWECLCGCGKTKVVARPELVKGDTKSCGCLKRKRIAEAGTTYYTATAARRKPVPRAYLRDGSFDDDLEFLERL